MAISSSNFDKIPGSRLTKYNAIELLNAGMSAGLFRQGLTQEFNYQQMLELKATTVAGYMAINNSSVKQAIEAISGQNIASYASSNGFVVETYNGVEYLKKSFDSSGTYTPPSLLVDLNSIVFLVAGGGAGSGDHGGGGGAGGVVLKESFSINSTISITIGQGGVTKGYLTSSNGRPHDYTSGQFGGNSILGLLTAYGGGAARGYNGTVTGWSGGSGGSGGGSSNAGPSSTATQPTSATGGFGNPGSGGNTGSQDYGGGGGGAGGAGSSTGAGGNGYSYMGQIYGRGGNNGTISPGVSGAQNTGNGGNGTTNPGTGGNGGSGIAFIRYNLSTTL